MQSVSPRRHSLKHAESLLHPKKHSIIAFSQFSMQSLRKSGTLKSQMRSNMIKWFILTHGQSRDGSDWYWASWLSVVRQSTAVSNKMTTGIIISREKDILTMINSNYEMKSPTDEFFTCQIWNKNILLCKYDLITIRESSVSSQMLFSHSLNFKI